MVCASRAWCPSGGPGGEGEKEIPNPGASAQWVLAALYRIYLQQTIFLPWLELRSVKGKDT